MFGAKLGQTKERAFQLWLDGTTYRKITAETGESTGNIGRIIEAARSANPDLKSLRALNIRLKDSNASITDLIRGVKLDFDLAVMEEELKKKTSKIAAAKASIDILTLERETLNEEILKIKAAFLSQDLTWDEALGILKNIKSLQDAFELWTNSLDAEIFDVEEKEKELVDLEKKEKRLQSSISTLSVENVQLNNEQRFYVRWMQEEAPKIWQQQVGLKDSVKNLKTELSQLKEETLITTKENEILRQRKNDLETAVKDLETFKGSLEKQCKNMFTKAKKKESAVDAACLKKIEGAKEEAKQIIADGEATRDRKLAGVRGEEEKWRKKVDVLRAEWDLIKIARKQGYPTSKQESQEPKKISPEQSLSQLLEEMRTPKKDN